jgi:hypothetical protein
MNILLFFIEYFIVTVTFPGIWGKKTSGIACENDVLNFSKKTPHCNLAPLAIQKQFVRFQSGEMYKRYPE